MGVVDNIRRFLTPGDYQEAAVVSMEQTNKFSPGVPIQPNDGYSRVPRAHDFLTGYNIAARPRRNERVSFTTLQGIIEAYDVAQMAITHRIDSVRSFDWYLEPLEGVSGDTSEMIDRAKQILKRPDHELPFRAWLSKFLWDVLAYDAGTLYRMRNNAGRCIGLRVVDGTTIAPLIDYHGNRPTGEAPAFVQFAQGVPWNWLTVEDLIYVPFRPLPNTPYGKAPMESILLNANTDLRFQNYFLSRFTEGTVPEGFAGAPEDWTPDQITDYQDAWDAVMYGDETKKHQIRWVPGGTNFTWTREEQFNSEFSLFMMRKTAAAYHVTPADLGFTETVNLASSETQLDVQFRIGDLPLIQHTQEILSDFLQNDLGMPLRFVFNTGQMKDDKMLTASIHDMYIKNGVLSVSEVRQEIYGLPEPDGVAIPRFLMGGAGPIPLNVIREGAGTTDPDTGSPMGTPDLEATQYDVAQGLTTNISPAGGMMPDGQPAPATAPAPEQAISATPVGVEQPVAKEATVGVTTSTGAYGSPMLSEEDDEDEDDEAKDMVAKELARFRRFVKARKKDSKWRDFEFRVDAISPFDAQRLNDEARWSLNPARAGLLCVRAEDTGRVLMLQRSLADAVHGGKLDFPGGHVEDGENFEQTAIREFREEVGVELPAGTMRPGWRHGGHEAYVYDIASEDLIPPREQRELEMIDPDDAEKTDGLHSEALMWMNLSDLIDNPMLKPELADCLDKIVGAVSDAVPLVKGWRESANHTPQNKYDLLIVDYYEPKISEATDAFLKSLNVKRIIDYARTRVIKAEGSELYPQVRAMLGTSGNTAELKSVITDLLADGYASGVLASAQQIAPAITQSVKKATASDTADNIFASIKWGEWKPGSPLAAERLANGGMRDLLNTAGLTVQSIQDSALDIVGDKIAKGVEAGTPTEFIAEDIRKYVNPPYRATMIAQTETARAQVASSLETYSQFGAGEWNVITTDGACDKCLEAEADNPHSVYDSEVMLPIHPFCRCAPEPVVPDFDGGDFDASALPWFDRDGGVNADGGFEWSSWNTPAGFLLGFIAGLGIGAVGMDIYQRLTAPAPFDETDGIEDGEDESEFDEFGNYLDEDVFKEWNEDSVERDENGRFASTGGGGSDAPALPVPDWVSPNNLVSASAPHVGLSPKAQEIASRISNITRTGIESTPLRLKESLGNELTRNTATYVSKNGTKINLFVVEMVRPDGGVEGAVYANKPDSANASYEINPFDRNDLNYHSDAHMEYGTDRFHINDSETIVSSIDSIGVGRDMQREGVATAMLEFARATSSTAVLHARTLTDFGEAFSEVVKEWDESKVERDENGRFVGAGGYYAPDSNNADFGFVPSLTTDKTSPGISEKSVAVASRIGQTYYEKLIRWDEKWDKPADQNVYEQKAIYTNEDGTRRYQLVSNISDEIPVGSSDDPARHVVIYVEAKRIADDIVDPTVPQPGFFYRNDEYLDGSIAIGVGNESNDSQLAITSVSVRDLEQRQGLATAMLEFARRESPLPIVHSKGLTDEGKAFSEVVKEWDESKVERDERGRFAPVDAQEAINEARHDGHLTEILRQTYGNIMTVGFGNRNLNLEKLKEMTRALVVVRDAYPQATVNRIEVRTMPSHEFGRTETMVNRVTGEVTSQFIVINSKMVNNNDSDRLDEEIRAKGDHAGSAVSAIESTIIHEYGHALDYSRPQGTRDPISIYDTARGLSESLGMSPEDIIKTQTSAYAGRNARETVAEAFVDVVTLGNDASPLSKALTEKLLGAS
jgi:8-oxo-dGTP pyrophosphatase MutT (NUDIX family)